MSGGVQVKICGITRMADALRAVELGATALGFNFWPRSKRYCPPERAARIISALPLFVTPVAVFVNASRAEVQRLAKQSGVRAVQLHGDETPAFCAGIPLPWIKAIPIEGPKSLRALKAFRGASAFLLDAPSKGYGGSGRAFDWSALSGARLPTRIILAGGLNPDNVGAAVRKVRPYAVDVASGVESAPGIKDAAKMKRFIEAAQKGNAE